MLKTTLSLGVAFHRLALPLLVASAITLMVLSRTGNPYISALRAGTADILAPVIHAASRPAAAINGGVERIGHFLDVHARNDRLRAENDRLLHWQAEARRLEAENREFRALLSVVAEPPTAFVTARIVSMSSSTFVRTILINAGAADGVDPGQAVVTAHGIVGRVVEVGARSSRVLLLTDLNSRVPVVLESSRMSAIVAGDNSGLLALAFVADDAPVAPGERLVTSGEGGMLPPGLPVGMVTGSRDGVWLVTPFVNPAGVEHVRVLDYALPGMLPRTQEAGAPEQLW